MNNKQIREDLARLQDELRLERYKRTMHRTNPETWLQLRIILKFNPYRVRNSSEKGKEAES